MEHNKAIQRVTELHEIDFFWSWHRRYMLEDILPDSTFEPSTKEDTEWFLSDKYKTQIMSLFHRAVDPLQIVFFQMDGVNIGFAVYVMYHSEDGKCFIVDFCVDRAYRNSGLGTAFFVMLRESVKAEGAAYIALNVSNKKNEKFWCSKGFAKASRDAYGKHVYEKRPV